MSFNWFLVVGGYLAVFLIFILSMAWGDYQTHQSDKKPRGY
jgi:hypothetical protein